MDRLGIRLGSMGRQVPPLATDVSTTAMELHALAAELAGLSISESAATALAWLVVGVVLLVAWLLVPALAALQVGTWLLRSPPAVTPA
jgi:hypothetical protein